MLKKIKTNNSIIRTIVLESKNQCEKCCKIGRPYTETYREYHKPKV